jgi:hypothetical protein
MGTDLVSLASKRAWYRTRQTASRGYCRVVHVKPAHVMFDVITLFLPGD